VNRAATVKRVALPKAMRVPSPTHRVLHSLLHSELIDQTPTTAAGGLAAAYKPNGDLALFFTDQNTLYVKKRINGAWQARSAWDKATGSLSGVAVVYNLDWYLLVTGQDDAGSPRLWSLAYGDGGSVPAGR